MDNWDKTRFNKGKIVFFKGDFSVVSVGFPADFDCLSVGFSAVFSGLQVAEVG